MEGKCCLRRSPRNISMMSWRVPSASTLFQRRCTVRLRFCSLPMPALDMLLASFCSKPNSVSLGLRACMVWEPLWCHEDKDVFWHYCLQGFACGVECVQPGLQLFDNRVACSIGTCCTADRRMWAELNHVQKLSLLFGLAMLLAAMSSKKLSVKGDV